MFAYVEVKQLANSLRLTIGGYSSQGIKIENQDAFAAWHPEGIIGETKGAAIAIADGVSACKKAKEASNTCVTSFVQDYFQTPETWTVKKSIGKILNGLNLWCNGQHDYQNQGHSQMLTTFSSLVAKSTTGFISHVGDSRIYRLQDGNFEQLTSDHAAVYGNARHLTRAMGAEPHLDVDFLKIDLRRGDLFLLSTDGVHDFVSNKQLSEELKRCQQGDKMLFEATAKVVVDQALKNNSNDNLTCVIVRIDDLSDPNIDEQYQQLTRLAMPPALEAGMKLEGYRVLQTVFNGTRSSLYKVVDDKTQQVFGLKTPSQHFADDPIYLAGFLREEWVGQRLNHPNIMGIHHRPDDAKFMYHVCEFIDGLTLRQWMLDNPTPSLSQVRQIIEPTISGLRIMQRQEMRHRDIKPENIMINSLGEVKLIDFGTVYVAALEETDGYEASDTPVGSVHYIAPEYHMSNNSSAQSDLFSLAVVVYELLTGKLPFKPFPYKDYVPTNYAEWEYISVRKIRPDLPTWIDLTLKKALQPNPKHRYEAYSEFWHDLNKPSSDLKAQQRSQPLIEKNPVLFWKGLSIVLFILIIVQWILLSH